MRKFENQKVHPSFIDNVLVTFPGNMHGSFLQKIKKVLQLLTAFQEILDSNQV